MIVIVSDIRITHNVTAKMMIANVPIALEFSDSVGSGSYGFSGSTARQKQIHYVVMFEYQTDHKK